MLHSRNYSGVDKHYNSADSACRSRREAALPGFQRVTLTETIEVAPFKFGDKVIRPEPRKRAITAWYLIHLNSEFYVRNVYGRWTATSPQMADWEYVFDLKTPVSDFCHTLEMIVLYWLSQEPDDLETDGFEDWFAEESEPLKIGGAS